MIVEIGRGAQRLDDYLRRRFGRSYSVLLTVGLVGEIVERIHHFPETVRSRSGVIELALTLALEFALLLHQVGALAHNIEKGRAQAVGGGE